MRFLVTLFVFSLPIVLFSQTITISGKVTDGDTKEGVPFCNIFFPGTTSGASTDLDGFYEITIDFYPDSIVASALGYTDLSKAVRKDSIQLINFLLSSEKQKLDEIVVYAGENPANRIVKGIIENKDKHRISKLSTYQYELYEKVELDLENLNENLLDNKFLKPFKFAFDNVDSLSDEEPFLPVYIKEMISDVYYAKEISNKEKVIPKAQKVSGIDNRTVIEFIDRIYTPYSMYDDWIYFLEKPFVSPFAKSGLGYYEYYIIDSAMVNDYWSYKLKFKPKRKQEATFFGDFWVADSVFAVQHLNMRMSEDVNINFVDRIIIFEEHAPNDQGFFLLSKKKLVVDFEASDKAPAIIGRHTTSYKDFLVNQEEINARYQEKPDIVYYSLDELEKEDLYWEDARHEKLSNNEAGIYTMIDSIQKVPLYQTYADILYTLFTGYKNLGAIEIGPYFSLYNNNPVEGHRFRLGAITSNSFSKEFQLGAYGAYGTRDEKFKYGLSFIWLMRKNPRRLLGIKYRNDVEFSTENSEAIGEGNLFSGVYRRDVPQKMFKINELKVFYDRSWNRHFSSRFTLLTHKIDPFGNLNAEGAGFNFAFMPDPEMPGQMDTTVSSSEFIVSLRYAHDEQFLEGNFDRISLGSKYPILELQLALGVKDLFGGQYKYQRLNLAIQHYFYINPIGWISYRFNAGKVFGTIPFLLLNIHPGNETYFYSKNAFNSMNRFEFISDLYASIMIEHHFEGFFFNKVPLLRKLKWREVVSFKGVIGSLSEENRRVNQFNAFSPDGDADYYTGFRSPTDRPYMEFGAGIENILKVFRVEALWRVNYLDNPEASRFGLRGGLNFYF